MSTIANNQSSNGILRTIEQKRLEQARILCSLTREQIQQKLADIFIKEHFKCQPDTLPDDWLNQPCIDLESTSIIRLLDVLSKEFNNYWIPNSKLSQLSTPSQLLELLVNACQMQKSIPTGNPKEEFYNDNNDIPSNVRLDVYLNTRQRKAIAKKRKEEINSIQ